MPIYEQSVNVREMILVRWHTTWRILSELHVHCTLLGLEPRKSRKLVILWYKFTPKGYIPLSGFYKIWRGEGVPGPHNHAEFRRCGFKMWA